MVDKLYRMRFMKIWSECMKNGFSSSDARDYASIELNNKLFNENTNNNGTVCGSENSEGIDRYSISISG